MWLRLYVRAFFKRRLADLVNAKVLSKGVCTATERAAELTGCNCLFPVQPS